MLKSNGAQLAERVALYASKTRAYERLIDSALGCADKLQALRRAQLRAGEGMDQLGAMVIKKRYQDRIDRAARELTEHTGQLVALRAALVAEQVTIHALMGDYLRSGRTRYEMGELLGFEELPAFRDIADGPVQPPSWTAPVDPV